MNTRTVFYVVMVVINFLLPVVQLQTACSQTTLPQSPESFFGFRPGADSMLFDYSRLIAYLEELDNRSPRVKLLESGKTPLGKKMYILFVSSEENINRLETLKETNRKLALDPALSETERKNLIAGGKVFCLATLSEHSNEVGPSQSLPLIAYDLATTTDKEKVQWLSDVVYMAVPCHNPDGMDMIVNHYKKYKGTKYDGCSMPGVYHKYVGHDNNRDFVTLTQEDTRAISRIFSKDWFPQVMVEKHQMGSTGVRYFVPQPHDPIAENIDAPVWNWVGIFGANLITDMTKENQAGIAQRYLFDEYWPGSTITSLWKSTIGFLTEAAGVKYASPIYIEPNELSVSGKGLSEYKRSINMPLPWYGGWWRLGDIVNYEIVSTLSMIKTASLHREKILEYRNDICRSEVNKGKTEAPYYYILPLKQHDPGELAQLVNLLDEHGIDVFRLSKPVTLKGMNYGKGDIVVPLAHPFRPFIKEVMELQQYPVRHYTVNGGIIKPYDITSWSLPLHMGVESHEIPVRSAEMEAGLEKITFPFHLNTLPVPENYMAAGFSVCYNESYKTAFAAARSGLKVERLKKSMKTGNDSLPAGSFIIRYSADKKQISGSLFSGLTVSPVWITSDISVETIPFSIPRIALVETWFHHMDAGWTRYIFDSYGLPYEVIRPDEFEKTDFIKNFDVVIIPDETKSLLMEGKYKTRDEQQYTMSSYPPEYAKGMGAKGLEKLTAFLDKGGIIISWGESTELFTQPLEISLDKDKKEIFQLPVSNISERVKKEGLLCPGAMLWMEMKNDHPLTQGMNKKTAVFSNGTPVFSTSVPQFDMDRRVIGSFPEKNILVSGYCENEESLSNKTPFVWLKKGKGQIVIMGFNPLFRANTHCTYKLVFNAILLPAEK